MFGEYDLSMLPLILALSCLLPSAPASGVTWVPTLADEFEGTSLDRSKWTDVYHGTSIWNGEGEAYVDTQVSVSGGLLHLRADKRPTTVFGVVQPYASGMVTTRGLWHQRYGYFEIRAKVPAGKGFWPAFWGLPDTTGWPPEIDVLEILGDVPKKVYMTSHWGILPLHLDRSHSWVGPDFSTDFHTFAVDWNPRRIRWYVDDTLRAENTEGIPQVPFYWLLNLAVGGDWPGYPDANTRFPSEFQVDWMRAWQYPSDSLAAFEAPPHLRFVPSPSGAVPKSGSPLALRLVNDSGSNPQSLWFYDGDALIATNSTGTLSADWTPTSSGAHSLCAVGRTSAGTWSEFAGTLVQVADTDGNLLANGALQAPLTDWTLWTQSGGGATVGTETWSGPPRATIRLTAVTTARWHVQFSQRIPLQKDWTYQISFQGRATGRRTVEAMLQQGGDPYAEWWTKSVAFTTDSASFGPWAFTPSELDSTASFKFNLGLDTAAVQLWNAKVVAIPPTNLSVHRFPSLRLAPRWYGLDGRKLSSTPSGVWLERVGNETRVRAVLK